MSNQQATPMATCADVERQSSGTGSIFNTLRLSADAKSVDVGESYSKDSAFHVNPGLTPKERFACLIGDAFAATIAERKRVRAHMDKMEGAIAEMAKTCQTILSNIELYADQNLWNAIQRCIKIAAGHAGLALAIAYRLNDDIDSIRTFQSEVTQEINRAVDAANSTLYQTITEAGIDVPSAADFESASESCNNAQATANQGISSAADPTSATASDAFDTSEDWFMQQNASGNQDSYNLKGTKGTTYGFGGAAANEPVGSDNGQTDKERQIQFISSSSATASNGLGADLGLLDEARIEEGLNDGRLEQGDVRKKDTANPQSPPDPYSALETTTMVANRRADFATLRKVDVSLCEKMSNSIIQFLVGKPDSKELKLPNTDKTTTIQLLVGDPGLNSPDSFLTLLQFAQSVGPLCWTKEVLLGFKVGIYRRVETPYLDGRTYIRFYREDNPEALEKALEKAVEFLNFYRDVLQKAGFPFGDQPSAATEEAQSSSDASTGEVYPPNEAANRADELLKGLEDGTLVHEAEPEKPAESTEEPTEATGSAAPAEPKSAEQPAAAEKPAATEKPAAAKKPASKPTKVSHPRVKAGIC